MKIRKILTAVLFTILLSAVFTGCKKDLDIDNEAKEWKPDRTVTIICGYGVGGSTDLFARLFAKELKKQWGVNVNVENIEGGSGAIGTTRCFYAKPDGYTVMVSNGATITQSVLGETEWKYNSFTNIAKIIDEDEVLCVNANSSINSMDELIKKCKREPGKVKIGVAGIGGYTYLVAQRFIDEQHLDVKVIAYDSGAEVISALMGGFIDFCIQQPAEIHSGIDAGKIKPITIMAKERHKSPLLENVPTSEEERIDFYANQWRGISAPPKLPENVKKKWEEAIENIADDSEFQHEVENILFARVNFVEKDELNELLNMENRWVENIMKKLGLVE